MGEISFVDVAMGAILSVAILRGLFLGLIREAFSIAAIGGAVVAVRMWNPAVAGWLADRTDLDALLAPWISGALIGIATIAAVAILGRSLRRGAQAAGLGWMDRLGGAGLGLVEGAVVVAVLLGIATTFLGRDHGLLRDTRSLAALTELERITGETAPRIDVAAPPR